MRKLLTIIAALAVCLEIFADDGIPRLSYADKAVAGLVGDGTFLVKTMPDSFTCVRGKILDGRFTSLSGIKDSYFFPGGVEYSFACGERVLYGVLESCGFVAAVLTDVASEAVFDGSCLKKKTLISGTERLTVFSERPLRGKITYEELKCLMYAPYAGKLVIDTPDDILDLSVQFSQYLLDLGFNGEFMLCELFRWLDIWARDLGSGLFPGALVSGREMQARKSLEYDLRRYALMSPRDCKNSNDPSQGGTAESVGWTVRSIWNSYMHSGDLAELESDMAVMRPWVDFWISRDYDEDGLIIDATEFMDHMIMMLTTDGVSTLAANAMFSCMLKYSLKIERELGNMQEASRYEQLLERTVNAINTVYWNEDKGYFNNMVLWGDVSERSAQPSQSMLLKMGDSNGQEQC